MALSAVSVYVRYERLCTLQYWAILIERLTQRDVLRNEVVFPGSFLDCCRFTRPESLCFFQTPEALSLPALVGISDISVNIILHNRSRRPLPTRQRITDCRRLPHEHKSSLNLFFRPQRQVW